MTRADDVLGLLADVGGAVDDDQIGARLDIDRHQVNALCRQLAYAGLIRREPGLTGKLVNSTLSTVAPTEVSIAPSGSAARATRRYIPRSERARRNVDELIGGFTRYVDTFEASEAFPGPSLYFHERALDQRRLHEDVESLLADERFFEYMYAVLPAWGMHRMGNQAAKVGRFDSMVTSFQSCRPLLESLWPRRITDIPVTDVESVTGTVWEVISQLRVSTSGTRIVAGSKALHHMLPDLVPPIDPPSPRVGEQDASTARARPACSTAPSRPRARAAATHSGTARRV